MPQTGGVVCSNQVREQRSYLGGRGDRAGGHPDRVDAAACILVDPYVGSLPLGLDVARRVEQVQHLLIVQLRDNKTTNEDYMIDS